MVFSSDYLSPNDFIDETVSDKHGKFVIHGSANDDMDKIDPRLRFINNASSKNSFPHVNEHGVCWNKRGLLY